MKYGFTLIELLVVITIIVALLALLTPALDKAIYEAELAVCGARIRAIASTAQVYAVDNKRRYPHRPSKSKPNQLRGGLVVRGGDDRGILRPYMAINALLNDPFSTAVDFEGSAEDSLIEASYHLWFGVRYPNEAGMFRLGDRFSFKSRRFGWLASDRDVMAKPGNWTHGSHPDPDGIMHESFEQDSWDHSPVGVDASASTFQFTLSRWQSDNDYRRGPLDLNFASSDGAVHQYRRVLHDDDARITYLPEETGSANEAETSVSVPMQ